MPGSTSMPSVEVAALTGMCCADHRDQTSLLIRMYRYTCSVALTNPDHQRTQLAFFEVGACFALWRTSGPRVPDVFAVAQTPNVKMSELVK